MDVLDFDNCCYAAAQQFETMYGYKLRLSTDLFVCSYFCHNFWLKDMLFFSKIKAWLRRVDLVQATDAPGAANLLPVRVEQNDDPATVVDVADDGQQPDPSRDGLQCDPVMILGFDFVCVCMVLTFAFSSHSLALRLWFMQILRHLSSQAWIAEWLWDHWRSSCRVSGASLPWPAASGVSGLHHHICSIPFFIPAYLSCVVRSWTLSGDDCSTICMSLGSTRAPLAEFMFGLYS